MEVRKNASHGPTNFAEYLTFTDERVWEILQGRPYLMTPAPLEAHQKVVMNLSYAFHHYLRGKDCLVRTAPYAVRLFQENTNHEDVKTVVHPDIAIICDKTKIDDYGCQGAPDLVVEVLSASTAHIDRGEKLHLYKEAGVREYWLIDPINERIEVYDFEHDPEQFFASAIYHHTAGDNLRVQILDSLVLHIADIFA